MKLTDEQLAFFVAKYGRKPTIEVPYYCVLWDNKLAAFTLGLFHQQAEVDRLREVLTMARGYIDAVCFNTPNPKKRNNYADALQRIDDVLAPDNATPGAKP